MSCVLLWDTPKVRRSRLIRCGSLKPRSITLKLKGRKFIIIIIIIIIIIKDTISIMQGIYTYIPETNHVPKQYNVAAILSLLFMVPSG
jgi:hypothetical protein